MNIYQICALGVTLLLMVAQLAGDNLKMLIVLAACVFLLALKTTWKFIFLTLEIIGTLLEGLGDGVSWVGGGMSDWSEDRKSNLATRPKGTSAYPEWGSSELHAPVAVTNAAGSSEDLDVPDSVKDYDKRAHDAGIGIFERR